MRKSGTKISRETRDKIIRLLDSHSAASLSNRFRVSVSAVYKIRNEHNHYKELATKVLLVAKDLNKYKESGACIGSPHCLGDVMFEKNAGALLGFLEMIDREEAQDLFLHLQREFDELKGINGWSELEDDNITPSLVNRLELKAHEGKFKGRCPHCPK